MKIRGNAPECTSLFLTQDDTAFSVRQVQNRIKYYGELAGIKNVRCSPHTFRHTFAKRAVRNNANIFELQKILGHNSMEMVRNYVTMFSDDIKEGHKKFSPLKGVEDNYFKVHVLGVMLTVSEKKQPKSYEKIKEWYESDEPEMNPILFSAEELAQ